MRSLVLLCLLSSCLVIRMSSISRTANLLARTSRSSLLRPRSVNPVQHVFAKDHLTARGMATVFERTKPHVNIGKKPFDGRVCFRISLANFGFS